VGARIIDSWPLSHGGTPAQVAGLKKAGVDGVALYLGVASKVLVDACLAAGLLVMGVTLAARYDGKAAVRQAKAWGLPAGVTLFLDLEGKAAHETPPGEMIAKINTWANDVAAAGYVPGLYVGVPQPLTSSEIYQLRVYRYWQGQGSTRDRNNALAEPSCGWCMTQMWPSQTAAGVLLDWNMVGQDYKTRVPTAASG
jgi:hypothetical protein